MRKLKPILTEKSLADAKEGRYTFWVSKGLNKKQIIKMVGEAFGVTVRVVRTVNYKRQVKKSLWTRRSSVSVARKKVVVTLGPKEKIAIFGEGEKK